MVKEMKIIIFDADTETKSLIFLRNCIFDKSTGDLLLYPLYIPDLHYKLPGFTYQGYLNILDSLIDFENVDLSDYCAFPVWGDNLCRR